MSEVFYLTTAIDYTNGAPHIGHAYEKVLADVIARYQRLQRGAEGVYFLTGVDQHGQKVQQSAESEGIAPQEFVDGITALFQRSGKSWTCNTTAGPPRPMRGTKPACKRSSSA